MTRTIDAQQLERMIQRPEPPLVIDVLPRSEFEKEHLPKAVNIPVDDDEFEAQVQRRVTSKDEEVVVYCASTACDASVRAASRLEKNGFSHVSDFEGGLREWKSANKPTEGRAAGSKS